MSFSALSRWFSRATSVVGTLVLLFAAFVGVASATADETSPFANLSVFGEALSIIERAYVEPVDQDALVAGALRGLLESLDPHSTYLDPNEYRTLRDDGEGRFAGVGIEVMIRDGWLTVMGVFEGGPAEEAGLLPGDRFLSIDGFAARDMRMREAVRRMRGPVGSPVRVVIRRERVAEDVEIELTRREVEVLPVEVERLPGCILHLRVRGFQRDTSDHVRAAISTLVEGHDASACGVLLDLRDNGGGLYSEAIRLSDVFLDEGVIVTTRGRGGRQVHEAHATQQGTQRQMSVVVVVNSRTASAAEIVAGALAEHDRAQLIGARTFGKGSVQSVVELSDGSGMKLTTALYYTPDGHSIQARGIIPDLVIEGEHDAPDDVLREEGLEGHLPAPQGSVEVARTPELDELVAPLPDGLMEQDAQLRAAYRTLLGDLTRQRSN